MPVAAQMTLFKLMLTMIPPSKAVDTLPRNQLHHHEPADLLEFPISSLVLIYERGRLFGVAPRNARTS